MALEAVDAAVASAAAALGVPEAWLRALALALLGLAGGWLVQRALRDLLLPLALRTPSEMDEALLRRTHGPAGLTVAFLGLWGAARVLVPEPDHAGTFRAVLVTGLLLIWGSALTRALVAAIETAARRRLGRIDSSQMRFLSRVLSLVVGVALLLTVLSVWGVTITPLLAGAGLIGIALALAAQDTLANFFAGVAIYLDNPYNVGHMVVIDQGASEIRGEVIDVGLRSTRILTRDDVLVTVPNSIIANGRIVNESAHVPRFRLRIPVSVAYNSDMEKVERVLTEIGKGHPKALHDPAPRARLRLFGESGVDWELLTWISDPADKGLVIHQLSMVIHRRFGEEGIRIPFPQRDVNLFEKGERED